MPRPTMRPSTTRRSTGRITKMLSRKAVLLCALTLAGAAAPAAERVECRAAADNWVESPPWEPHSSQSLNHGSDQRLIISGRNSFALLAFDMGPARGLRLE